VVLIHVVSTVIPKKTRGRGGGSMKEKHGGAWDTWGTLGGMGEIIG
jgi:hypothetical protein